MATSLSSVGRSSHTITTPRLILRSAVQEDAEVFHRLLTKPENLPFDPTEDLPLDQMSSRISRFTEQTAVGKSAHLVIASRETDQLVGYGGFNLFKLVEPRTFLPALTAPLGMKVMGDFGVVIDTEHWKKGYGREVFSGLVEYAVNELGVEIFRVETGEANVPWRTLMGSMGLDVLEEKSIASFDDDLEVILYKFDAARWEEAKEKMKKEGKWPL